MTEDQLIKKYSMFVYYDAVERFENENPGKYFEDLSDKEKIDFLEAQTFYSLGC